MNEITRIHIAKTAYDIEVAAKKQLEKYIKSLETYTQDDDVLRDIEIRITEILHDRGVKAGGVISSDDVTAVREQLGEPYEFADEDGDIAVGTAHAQDTRRFYRNIDNAVLGGVLSGIAAYFKIDPFWTRVVFVILLLVSFGTAMVAYIVLWIFTPPARTAAEKLQLDGQPVTARSIRKLNKSADHKQPNKVAPVVQRILSLAAGIISLCTATAIAVVTIGIAVLALRENGEMFQVAKELGGIGGYVWLAWLVYGLVVAGLLLLASLFVLIGYAFFKRAVTKRMVVTGVTIIVLGVAAAVSVGTIALTGTWRASDEAQRLVRTTKTVLPEEFSTATSVVVSGVTDENDFFGSKVSVRYIADGSIPRYEWTALPGAKPRVTVKDNVAHISTAALKDYRNRYIQPLLTIYGPKLETFEVNAGVWASYTVKSQPALTIKAQGGNGVSVSLDGSVDALIVIGEYAQVDAAGATVRTLEVRSGQDLSLSAGTVKTLTVTQPDVCPSQYGNTNTIVEVAAVSSNIIRYNGEERPAETYRAYCAAVIVGDESDETLMNY